MPHIVATLATSNALADLRVFLKTIVLWNEPPTIYLYTDSTVAAAIPSFDYKGRLIHKNVLDSYTGLTRAEMERLPGPVGGASLFFDLTLEKLNLLQWVFDSGEAATFFFDSDICFLGPLPTIPDGTAVALSPHLIRPGDEARFGEYNAGFLWMTPAAIPAWRAACSTSRFFEQAALECFNAPEWNLYRFPIQHNYGWWRLWQGRENPATLLASWKIHRNPAHAGIVVDGQPLCSVHTHWGDRDPATANFNRIVLEMLGKMRSSHPPAKRLLALLASSAS
jgi:hypothetical protein